MMIINILIFSSCISSVISCKPRGLPPDFNPNYPWIGPRLRLRIYNPHSHLYGAPLKVNMDIAPDAPLLFTPILRNADCKLQGADSCDLVKIDFNVLWKHDSIFFLDGYIWNYFYRHKTYQLKNNILSIYKSGLHDQAVFLHNDKAMEGFVEFYHNQSNVKHDSDSASETFYEIKTYIATGIFQFTFTNCGSNCTILKRYQGRTSWGDDE